LMLASGVLDVDFWRGAAMQKDT